MRELRLKLEDDKEYEIEHITRALSEIILNASNPDSHFHVAAIIRYRTKSGKIKYSKGVNTEMTYALGGNVCGERNGLGHARLDGEDIQVLDIWVLGGDRGERFNKDKLRYTPCCSLCLDQLLQFSVPETQIHMVPLNYGREDQVKIAVANIQTKSIFELIPRILHYSVKEAFDRTNSEKTKPAGMYAGKDKSKLANVLQDGLLHAVQILKSKAKVNSKDLELPPIHGELTQWFANFGASMGLDKPDLNIIGTVLATMRNERLFWYTDDIKGNAVVSRVEAAIAVTEDRRFFGATTIFGNGVPKQKQALSSAIDMAYLNCTTPQKITHVFMQGDPIDSKRGRMFPLVSELYLMTKRGTILESADGSMKLPGMRVFVLPPLAPGKPYEIDSRPSADRLKSAPGKNIVSSFRLDELTGPAVFFPAKQQRTSLGL